MQRDMDGHEEGKRNDECRLAQICVLVKRQDINADHDEGHEDEEDAIILIDREADFTCHDAYILSDSLRHHHCAKIHCTKVQCSFSQRRDCDEIR